MRAMSGTIWRRSPDSNIPDRWRRARSGLTMVELLVAMVILLVGIYAVAKGFPSLFTNIDQERQRSEMGRLCQETIERLKDDPSVLPEVVTGHDPATGGLIHPDSEPDDTVLAASGNARDDLIEVLGEVFTVPGVDPSALAAVYPLNQGPVAVDASSNPLAQVRELVKLERLSEAPTGLVPNGTFFVDRNGSLLLPSGLSGAFVDYCWVDTAGQSHYAYGEYVTFSGNVRAAGVTGPPAFAAVVEQSCRATGFIEYNVLLGGAGDVAAGTCVVEQTYGATLLFDPSAAGKVIQVDYTLRTEDDANGNPRRALMVKEEVPAPVSPPYELDLAFEGLDDENPLYKTTLNGTDLDPDVYLLAVDLQTGNTYTDAGSEVTLDMTKGTVTFTWASPAAMHGHELRIYYRTLNDDYVQIQKAPQYFIEDVLASQYTGAETAAVDYREYTASADTGDATYTVLTFPESVAGQAVTVDYVYGTSSPYERVTAELHVIAGEAPHTVVLDNPNVQAIVGVQGVSLKVRGWWMDARGRLQKLDLDTFLTPKKLL